MLIGGGKNKEGRRQLGTLNRRPANGRVAAEVCRDVVKLLGVGVARGSEDKLGGASDSPPPPYRPL